MSNRLVIEGLMAPTGTRYVLFQINRTEACIPLNKFAVGMKGAGSDLAEAGIPIIGNAAWAKVTERISKLEEWTEFNVIERVGWNGGSFALPDGSVFSSDGEPFIVAFEKLQNKCSVKGTLQGWKKNVARPLEGQHLAIFTLMLAFMPPLLALTQRVGNFGFEIVGQKGTGKSTLQHLMSSILGGAIQGDDGHYWISLDTTLNAIEDVMPVHSDLPIIMDEANLLAADATRQVKAARFQAIAFKLGYGSQKGRLGFPATRDYRLGFLISSNEPLASLIGTNESARAAADRLITLPLDEDHHHGVFDYVPDGFDSASMFARALIAAANEHHGTAIRSYLDQLTKTRGADETALKREIESYLGMFRSQVGVDGHDGSVLRIVDAFGLVYAAGRIAQRFKVLPRKLDCGKAALASYYLHLKQNSAETMPFDERLQALAANPEAVHLDSKPPPSADTIQATPYVFDKQGTRMFVHPSNIEELFPDWDDIKRVAMTPKFLKRDGKHMKVKKTIVPREKPKRVYCFRVPKTA